MDTKTLISEAKARFNHNSAKAQLKDKYDGKFIVAEQGGLWKATPEFIAFLSALEDDNFVILIDTFDNPVEVKREQLLEGVEENGDVVTWQDLTTGESRQVVVEEISFTRMTPPDKRFDGFGGVIEITIRTV